MADYDWKLEAIDELVNLARGSHVVIMIIIVIIFVVAVALILFS